MEQKEGRSFGDQSSVSRARFLDSGVTLLALLVPGGLSGFSDHPWDSHENQV